jgi:hypothetical protein
MLIDHRQTTTADELTTMGETMQQREATRSMRATIGVVAVTALLTIVAATVSATAAFAGTWMRISCQNPDGSPAPSEGWTGDAVGNVSLGSTNNTNCSPGTPSMYAALAMPAPAADGSSEFLAYTPPAGSTLVGGSLLVGLQANGYGFRAAATAVMFTPAYQYDATNVFLQCVAILAACQNGLPEYYGVVNIPTNRGGNLYLGAGCEGQLPEHVCSHGGSRGVWSSVAVAWANLLLSTDAQTTGADFRGTLLDAGAHGTANLAFTAGDPGPGVYKVAVTIGTREVYNQTPNKSSGKCVPVGTDTASGALMFDHQQPCPQSQTLDIPVRTTTFVDGAHELKVTVTNAAQNVSTVLRRTITINNRTTISTSGTSSVEVVEADAPPGAAPVYAIVLDPVTQALLPAVRSRFAKSGLSLSGTLRNSAGVPAPGVPIRLIAQNAGESASAVVTSTTTDGAGHWVLFAPQGPSRKLTIVYGAQAPTPEGGVTISQSAKPALTLRIRALGRCRLRFTGRLGIFPLSSPRPLVVIQARNGRRWQAVGSAVRVSPTGAYKLTYSGGRNVIGGSYSFRAVAPSTQSFLTATSPIRRTRVR